ncbi:thiol:disulfide interchange protein DsbA/DsbL [Vibrio sp. JC009]|uniref:thiol:disulfide interchange protein DsbA/DsbL n=1 Tax=Vibrio sp. JC009 TaxID=2912314 RepID=UPI0023B058C4|nr:thiol:disulfide interchange protein DsbA/DsbL [Vibrio sp. JC009]WED24577.1 thiol:disulfide interchange protein DsbA/DsbL [Vibrio sp. JC009]
MKKLFTLFSALVLSFAANAAQFTEGKHYKVLDLEASKQPLVTEFFSFYCGHCYKFEGVIAQLKENIPENARFQKVHVAFMGSKMAVPMAKAYATMVVLKNEKKMIPAMFRQVQDLRQDPKNVEELRQIFIDNGTDPKKFDAAFNGFAVDSMQKRFDKQFNNSELTGVPGVVVNNKYVVDAGSINTIGEYIDLVNYLLKM